ARQVLLQCRMLGCVIPTFDILFSRPRQRFGYFSCVDLTTGQISWYRTGREPESSARETSSSTRKTNFVLDAQTKIVSDVNRFFGGGTDVFQNHFSEVRPLVDPSLPIRRRRRLSSSSPLSGWANLLLDSSS